MSEHTPTERSSIVRICSEIILAFIQSHLRVDTNGKISNGVLINNIFHHSRWNNFSLECFSKYLYSPSFKFYFTLLYFSVHLSSAFASVHQSSADVVMLMVQFFIISSLLLKCYLSYFWSEVAISFLHYSSPNCCTSRVHSQCS